MDLVLPRGCLDNRVGGALSLGRGAGASLSFQMRLRGGWGRVPCPPLTSPSFIMHLLTGAAWELPALPGVGEARIQRTLQVGQREEV